MDAKPTEPRMNEEGTVADTEKMLKNTVLGGKMAYYRAPLKDSKKTTPQVDGLMPLAPDPLWPEGIAPGHLSVAAQNSKEVVDNFSTVLSSQVWHCAKCGGTVGKSIKNDKLCNECYDKEIQNSALAQRTNSNWMEQSEALGLAIFERQPEETPQEWMIWDKYRSYYPGKLPTWTALAAVCGTSVATVMQASQRWSFKVRLVAWSRFTDSSIQERRIAAIKEMNTKQLNMSQKLMDKLKDAIDCIDPTLLKPSEIANLFKLASDMERKIVTYVDEKVDSNVTEGKNKQISLTKPEDLSEVASILNGLGLLQGKTVGIEQTTRIIAKEND